MKQNLNKIFLGPKMVELIDDTGIKKPISGLISRYKYKYNNIFDSTRSKLGRLSDPLFLYIGDCEALLDMEEATLIQAEESFRMIKAEWVRMGATPVYVRAVLERI